MADQFTETKTTGYLSRIGNSFIGILIGILLIVGSVWVLFTNEGRVDMSKVAKTAVEISAMQLNSDQTLNGKLISSTGILESNEQIGDGLYLKPGKYIAFNRRVEMYSWIEKEKTESKKNMGGSETTETTYSYSKDWTEYPGSASKFKYASGHENPQKAYQSETKRVQAAKLGVYAIDPSSVDLPSMDEIQPTGAEYVFYGKGSITAPELGDLRISYSVLPSGKTVTIFGKLNGSSISSYSDKKDNKLYRIFNGSRDDAVDIMKGEYKMMLWIIRIVGFMMMWIGLQMIFEPISVLLDILPMLGGANRFLFAVISFFTSLIFSIVIILVSIVVHNIVVLLIVLAAIIAAVLWYLKQKKK